MTRAPVKRLPPSVLVAMALAMESLREAGMCCEACEFPLDLANGRCPLCEPEEDVSAAGAEEG